MRKIALDDLDDISRGAAVLGTGGGGDPFIGKLLATAALREHGPVPLVTFDEVGDDAVAFPVAALGAPTILIEKLATLEQAGGVAGKLAHFLGREPTHVLCAEVGGMNSLIPVAAAAVLGLPVVDCDGLGRAFPEIQMGLPALAGLKATPLALGDEKGNVSVIDSVDNLWAERLARVTTVEMGCSTMVSAYVMTGRQVRETMVPGTLSLCAELGRLVEDARRVHTDPAEAVVGRLAGRRLFSGKVVDVDRRTERGFALGDARLSGLDTESGAEMLLRFQNEYLVAERDGSVLVTTPDLICTLDTVTGEAVTTEGLRYGQRITVVAAPADHRWHTPGGYALVGPRYFGYDYDPVRV